ncbi:hypothetical protein PM082_021737 [Marasmius tenuissimus]|nr:hypothetical protein PM082_021737 [Marasmius tenuissimus]
MKACWASSSSTPNYKFSSSAGHADSNYCMVMGACYWATPLFQEILIHLQSQRKFEWSFKPPLLDQQSHHVAQTRSQLSRCFCCSDMTLATFHLPYSSSSFGFKIATFTSRSAKPIPSTIDMVTSNHTGGCTNDTGPRGVVGANTGCFPVRRQVGVSNFGYFMMQMHQWGVAPLRGAVLGRSDFNQCRCTLCSASIKPGVVTLSGISTLAPNRHLGNSDSRAMSPTIVWRHHNSCKEIKHCYPRSPISYAALCRDFGETMPQCGGVKGKPEQKITGGVLFDNKYWATKGCCLSILSTVSTAVYVAYDCLWMLRARTALGAGGFQSSTMWKYGSLRTERILILRASDF